MATFRNARATAGTGAYAKRKSRERHPWEKNRRDAMASRVKLGDQGQGNGRTGEKRKSGGRLVEGICEKGDEIFEEQISLIERKF